nr:hypothetical protein [Kibdelosporangium sp. MJ126-NF4]
MIERLRQLGIVPTSNPTQQPRHHIQLGHTSAGRVQHVGELRVHLLGDLGNQQLDRGVDIATEPAVNSLVHARLIGMRPFGLHGGKSVQRVPEVIPPAADIATGARRTSVGEHGSPPSTVINSARWLRRSYSGHSYTSSTRGLTTSVMALIMSASLDRTCSWILTVHVNQLS